MHDTEKGFENLISKSGLYQPKQLISHARYYHNLQVRSAKDTLLKNPETVCPNFFFDPVYYRKKYGTQIGSQSAIVHFILHGDSLDFNPSPLFDTARYKENVPNWRQQAGIQFPTALSHFLTIGKKNVLLDVNDYFESKFYLSLYPDVKDSGIHPLIHYLSFGERENRLPSRTHSAQIFQARNFATHNASALACYIERTEEALTHRPNTPLQVDRNIWDQTRSEKRKYLLIGHDADRAGAQLLLHALGNLFVEQFGLDVDVVLLRGGTFLEDYQSQFNNVYIAPDEPALRHVLNLLKSQDYSLAIVNTVIAGWTVPILKANGIPSVALIHELADTIRDHACEQNVLEIAKHTDHIIYPTHDVQTASESFLNDANEVSSKSAIIPQGIYQKPSKFVSKAAAREHLEIFSETNALYFINVGAADHRKGFDRFLQLAQQISLQQPNARLIWIGNLTATARAELDTFKQTNPNVAIFCPGFVSNVADHIIAADVFLMTSREDPFPSSNLEAMLLGVPILALQGHIGTRDLILTYGQYCVDGTYDDIAKQALEMAIKPDVQKVAAGRTYVRETYDFAKYGFELASQHEPMRKISVVVPNFNYADYLAERLDSIFQQSHPVFETIILDDASTDNSVEVVDDILRTQKRRAELVTNHENSGSGYIQWRKGLEKAKGDYLWIAEADDVASPDFLDALMPIFKDPKVGFCFCDSKVIDSAGQPTGAFYAMHGEQVHQGLLSKNRIIPGEEFLRTVIAVRNLIPNGSAVVWRKDALQQAFASLPKAFDQYKVATDWALYALAAKAGYCVGYNARSLNGHRLHDSATTLLSNSKDHLREVAAVHELILGFVDNDQSLAKRQRNYRHELQTIFTNRAACPPSL